MYIIKLIKLFTIHKSTEGGYSRVKFNIYIRSSYNTIKSLCIICICRKFIHTLFKKN